MNAAAQPGRLPPLEIDQLDLQQRAVLDQVSAGRGRVPTPYRVWIGSPELAERLHPLGRFFASETSLTAAESEIAILCAASRWRADYVLAVHTEEALAAGVEPAVVTALVQGRPAAPTDDRQRAVAELLAALGRDGVPEQQVFDSALAVLGANGVAELLALVGYFTAVALAMKTYAVVPPTG